MKTDRNPSTRVKTVEESRRSIFPEEGDVEISLSQLPRELSEALEDIIDFGVQRRLILGRVSRIKDRVVCVQNHYEQTNGRPVRLIKAFSRISETSDFHNFVQVKGTYSGERPSAWPIYGVEAEIGTSLYSRPVSVDGSLEVRKRGSAKQLTVEEVFLNVYSFDFKTSVNFVFYSEIGGLMLSERKLGQGEIPISLMSPGRKTQDGEIRKLGFKPSLVKEMGMEDMIRLQALITSGVLKKGDFNSTCQQISILIKQIKTGK